MSRATSPRSPDAHRAVGGDASTITATPAGLQPSRLQGRRDVAGNLAIAIPMKSLPQAKSRLTPLLADGPRQALAYALYRRTLAFFQRHYPSHPLLVVTDSDDVTRLALEHGATVLAEPAPRGLNAAADTAARYAAQAGFASLLLVHADIPLLACDELDTLIATAAFADVAIAESTDGGTNAMLVSPPLALPFHYGPNSADLHTQAARDRQLVVARLKLARLSRDLDTPADFAQLLQPAAELPALAGAA